MRVPRPSRPSERRLRALEILPLSAFAVAQPLFDVLARDATFFVAHGSRRVDLIAFTAVIYLLPFLLPALAVGLLGRVSPRLGAAAHSLVAATLVAAILMPPLERLGTPMLLVLGVATLAGIAFAAGLERFAALRAFLRLLAPLSLAIPLLFLFASPVAEQLTGDDAPELEVEVERPAPIVFLLLDELPVVSLMNAERRIDAELFPNFARLAAVSHWFRNATTVTHNTNYAVPALLTGSYPRKIRAPIARDYPASLFTLLGAGYDFHVRETQTRLCPRRLCGDGDGRLPFGRRLGRLLSDSEIVYLHVLLPEELSRSLPAVTATWADFATEAPGGGSVDLAHVFTVDRSAVFRDFVDGLERSERPTLHFLHLMLPHVPWAYLPSGREYWASITSSALADGVGPDSTWTEEAWLVAQGYQRHLLQVAFVDRLLGELLDRMEATGLLDEALLVVTADHGLAFQPGEPWRDARRSNFADIMAVPLFIHEPGQRQASLSDRNVELIDLLPTLAEILGFELPAPIDGVSAFADGPERPRKVLQIGPADGFTFTSAELEARERSLERKLGIFADGLFSIGPHPELVGRPVAELATGPASGVEVRLDQPDHYRDVDLDGRFLPSQVFGHARWRSAEPGHDLAIALNGVVWAVTRTFRDPLGRRFVAMLPERAFLDGENRVDVFVVEGAPGSARLHATVRNAAPVYRIAPAEAGRPERLVASDGAECRLDASAVEGAFLTEGTGHLGWAHDTTGQRPYAVIMAFADGRLVHTTTTGAAPPRSSPVAGRKELAGAGFRFNLPAALVDETGELRLFAVLGDRCAELFELAD